MTYPAVKAFREKGVRNIHTLTCEEGMGKREVKNSLPPTALMKKSKAITLCLKLQKTAPKGGLSIWSE